MITCHPSIFLKENSVKFLCNIHKLTNLSLAYLFIDWPLSKQLKGMLIVFVGPSVLVSCLLQLNLSETLSPQEKGECIDEGRKTAILAHVGWIEGGKRLIFSEAKYSVRGLRMDE